MGVGSVVSWWIEWKIRYKCTVARYRGVDGMFDVDGRRVVVCEGYVPSHLILACTVAELTNLGKMILLPRPWPVAGAVTTAKAKKYDKGNERECRELFGLKPRKWLTMVVDLGNTKMMLAPEALGRSRPRWRLTKGFPWGERYWYDLSINDYNGIIRKNEDLSHRGWEWKEIQISCRFLSLSVRWPSRLLRFSGNVWRRDARDDVNVCILRLKFVLHLFVAFSTRNSSRRQDFFQAWHWRWLLTYPLGPSITSLQRNSSSLNFRTALDWTWNIAVGTASSL